jgi:hypothetical protein
MSNYNFSIQRSSSASSVVAVARMAACIGIVVATLATTTGFNHARAGIEARGSSFAIPAVTVQKITNGPVNVSSPTKSELLLRELTARYPKISAAIADAGKFIVSLPLTASAPQISTDGETEVVVEWIKNDYHAIVSFEGDGEFGYAMRPGDQFIPGRELGATSGAPPIDLLHYISKL